MFYDFLYFRVILKLLSFFQSTDEMFAKKLNERFDHAKYSLQPNFPPFSSHPTINDDLPNRIICGSIKIKPNVKKFTKTGVEFEDGTFEDDIDAVILATGYRFGFPFLDKSVIDVVNNKVQLYKSMFPPDLEKKDSGLYWIYSTTWRHHAYLRTTMSSVRQGCQGKMFKWVFFISQRKIYLFLSFFESNVICLALLDKINIESWIDCFRIVGRCHAS